MNIILLPMLFIATLSLVAGSLIELRNVLTGKSRQVEADPPSLPSAA